MFVDEVANCLYIVDGIALLNYIVEHYDNVRQSDNSNNFYIVIPKSDIAELVSSPESIVRYNKAISDLFANCRDESQYAGLL